MGKKISNLHTWTVELDRADLEKLGLLATHVVTTLAANEGVGRHQWDVPLANMPEILKV